MGKMPSACLLPSVPFSSVMVDLFSPYLVRGEVQKKISGKAWGVIFTDLCSRAMHIEVAFGYDMKSFLPGLCRFAAIQGWPSAMYSDPGTQLVGTSSKLVQAWKDLGHDAIAKVGADSGMEWKLGPADSPWYQGAVEILVKAAKRALDLSVRGIRLSVPDILTAFTQAADLFNKRPLGIMPSLDPSINVITPNSLLLGRSSSRMLQKIVSQFWTHWTNLYAPMLIRQSKWLYEQRDIQVGDVVLVADPSVRWGEYRLARVSAVLPSSNGGVRKAKVTYKKYKVGEKVHQYSGATDTEVERSVQRLALLVPIHDQ